MPKKLRSVAVPALLAWATLLPSACDAKRSAIVGGPGSVHVVASFYPLQYVVEHVGGDIVTVENLTPVGAEPHEIELTAKNTASLEDSDLVVYLSGFAPAVDDGVASVANDHALDVADAAELDLRYNPIETNPVEASRQGSTGTRDPHFWLDPTRLEAVATAVAARLTALDPSDATVFSTNADALIKELQALDAEYSKGLAKCANTVIVTSHNAFGYLAQRYGLTQMGITGLTPEDEPSPAALAAVSTFVEDNHISTVYYETLVSPTIAATVATETGAKTAVLDPIEGPSSTSRGADYLGVMRGNLASLRAGQACT